MKRPIIAPLSTLPSDASDMDYRTDSFVRACYKLIKFETKVLQKYYGNPTDASFTVGVYFMGELPRYIIRRNESLNLDYWIVMNPILAYQYEFALLNRHIIDEKLRIEESERQSKAEKEAEKIAAAERRAQKQTQREAHIKFTEAAADKWLERNKHNAREWRETFEPDEVEKDKLWTLMDKKMLE